MSKKKKNAIKESGSTNGYPIIMALDDFKANGRTYSKGIRYHLTDSIIQELPPDKIKLV